MDEFLVNISSFPTAIYTTTLVVVVGYWILAFIGVLDLDAFDVGLEIDLDLDGDVSEMGRIAGLLTTLGLTGVPITIVISLLLLNAWIICYFASLIVPTFVQSIPLVSFVISFGVAAMSLVVSIFITVAMVTPLKGLFRKLNQAPKSRSLLGSTCKIRSSRADNEFGEAECQHEGASLIIKVRTSGNQKFTTGEAAVLIEHNNEKDFFYIVSEKEFKQQLD